MATLNELFNNEDTQPIVIFQTDGDQLDSLKGGKGVLGPYAFPRKYGLEDIMTATERVRANHLSGDLGSQVSGFYRGRVA